DVYKRQLMERLAVVLVDADDRQFRQLFERAMFAAEIMGYAAAGREAIGKPAASEQQAAPEVRV
ncbi:MAG: hypothetical protein N2690_08380, partial [Rhodocyclaceae bacterium]|nr:hypothetical protein [Rhodocyclaceae bacterium]